MTLPVTIPNTFANATTSIPLANLDANFVTIYDAVNGIGNGAESLANVSITGGSISNTSVSATTLNTSGQVVFNDAGADVDFRVEGDTDANLLFVDASTDRVGIGTDSPTTNLNIASTDVPNLRFNHTDAGTTDKLGGVQFGGGADVSVAEVAGYYDGATDNGALVFSTEPTGGDLTERMRITSAGEVLVGGTTEIGSSSGYLTVQKTNDAAALLLFRNDTSIASDNVLGSVSFYGNDTTSNAATLHAAVQARASGTHAAGDNPTDLVFFTTPDNSATVAEVARFTQDKYLRMASGTGGIQFGGDTAAANALDDYEEGTWTVQLYDDSSSGNVSSTTATGYYTKIGRSVSINFYISNVSSSGLTAGNAVYFTLPFTPSADNAVRTNGAVVIRAITFPSANYTAVTAYVSGGAARGALDAVGSGVNSSLVLWSGVISGSGDFSVQLTYNV